MPALVSKETREEQLAEFLKGSPYCFVGWEELYHGNTTRITMLCEKHGLWSPRLAETLSGRRCAWCANRGTYTKEQRQAQLSKFAEDNGWWFVGFDSDDFSAKGRVTFLCAEHGVFGSDINHAVSGCGCKKCGLAKWHAENPGVDAAKVVTDACVSRGYSLMGMDGANSSSWLQIKCEEHGVWRVSYNNFVYRKSGCPKCANYGYNWARPGTLYALRSDCGRYIKVGASNSMRSRNYKLRQSTPFDFDRIAAVRFENGETPFRLEQQLLAKYESAGLSGFDGSTEWLLFSEELLEELQGISK